METVRKCAEQQIGIKTGFQLRMTVTVNVPIAEFHFGNAPTVHMLLHDLIRKQQFPHLFDRQQLNAHQAEKKYTEYLFYHAANYRRKSKYHIPEGQKNVKSDVMTYKPVTYSCLCFRVVHPLPEPLITILPRLQKRFRTMESNTAKGLEQETGNVQNKLFCIKQYCVLHSSKFFLSLYCD